MVDPVPLKNAEALAPEGLEHYANRAELQS
jgi:hypothetical protein